MSNSKIILPYNYPQNTGDAAILKSTLCHLKKEFENVDFYFFSEALQGVEEESAEFNFVDFNKNGIDKLLFRGAMKIVYWKIIFWMTILFKSPPMFLLPGFDKKVYKYTKDSEAAILPGGGYLTDAYDLSRIMAYCNFCLKNNIKLYFQSQSFGPLLKSSSKRGFKKIIKASNLYIVRDKKSVVDLKAFFGRNLDNVFPSVDQAFALERKFSPNSSTGTVGISVREWSFKDKPHVDAKKASKDFVSNVRNLVCELVKKGKQVEFVSTCQGIESYIDDSVLAQKIVDGLPSEVKAKVIVNKGHYSPKDLMDLFEGFELFFGTRMHSVILNMLVGTPVIGIAYEFKSLELFKNMRLEEYVMEYENPDVNCLVNIYSTYENNSSQYMNALRLGVEEHRNQALKNVKKIKTDFLNK